MPENTAPKPFFSIITATLNNARGLKNTHDSLKMQKTEDYEWLVMDGGSSDDSLVPFKDSKAIIHSEADDGPFDAMNKGIDRARGQYLLFLNAGDTLSAPQTLEKIKEDTKPHIDFIYGDSTENGYQKPARNPDIARGMFTHHQSMLYAREKIGDLRYNTPYNIAADYDFTARFLKRCQQIQYCKFPICDFEPDGISQKNAKTGRIEEFKIRKALNLTSPVRNHTITTLQSASWLLRRVSPALYWRLKSSGNI